MKKLFKKLGILLLLMVLGILLFIILNYKSDIPVSTIKAKYELPHSQYTKVLGMNVHYTIEGTGDTLVLLHGTSSSLHTWDQWTNLLKDKYTIIRMDLPGFGITGPHPQNKYDNQAYMEFLNAFFNNLQIQKAHVGGNSFGGYLTWLFGLHYPEKVDKLILVDPSGYPLPEGTDIPLGFKMASHPITAAIMNKITPRFLVEKTVYDAYEEDDKISQEIKDRYYDLLLREGNRKGLTEKMQQIKREHWQRMSEIKAPTLIMWGDKDEVLSVKAAPRFHEDLPNSQLIIYPNIGHIPMEEIPQQSAADVRAFLN